MFIISYQPNNDKPSFYDLFNTFNDAKRQMHYDFNHMLNTIKKVMDIIDIQFGFEETNAYIEGCGTWNINTLTKI